MSTQAPHFFISYSPEDADRKESGTLHPRGIRLDRSAFTSLQQFRMRTARDQLRGTQRKADFQILLSGDEDDSIPLRLSNHQPRWRKR